MISIVVPSFNQGEFLAATLESIVNQNAGPYECIVVDGGSCDGTSKVLDRYRNRNEFIIISEPDDGVVDAVNKGLRLANGDIIAIQSSDDLFLPGAFQQVKELFSRTPEAGMVFSECHNLDERGRVTGRFPMRDYTLDNLLNRTVWIPQCSAFLSRSAVLRTGFWDASISYVADADYYIRVALEFPVVKTDFLLGQRRVHPLQRDRMSGQIREDYSCMVEKMCADVRLSRKQRNSLRAGRVLLKLRYPEKRAGLWRIVSLLEAFLLCPTSLTRELAMEELWNRPCKILRALMAKVARLV